MRPYAGARVAALAAMSTLLVACGTKPPYASPGNENPGGVGGERGVVEWVVDGDTLRVRVEEESRRVRLIGVDAPETHDPRECWAAESAARLAELTPPGSAVWLTADREPRDHYGRDLRYVSGAGDVPVNETLVSDGAAVAIKVEPNTARWDALRAAERAARTARHGGWGACPSDAPPWAGAD